MKDKELQFVIDELSEKELDALLENLEKGTQIGSGLLKSIKKKFNKIKKHFTGRTPTEIRQQDPEYDLYSKIAQKAYRPDDERVDVDDYDYVDELSNKKRAVYRSKVNPKKKIVSFRGTDFTDTEDIADDIKIARDALEEGDRYKSEDELIKKLKDEGYDVSLTGHSLGSTLADRLSRKYDLPAYTFNKGSSVSLAELVRNIDDYFDKDGKRKHYRVSSDPLSFVNPLSRNVKYKADNPHAMSNFLGEGIKKLEKLTKKELIEIIKELIRE